MLINGIGVILYMLGGIAVLGIDVVSTLWLASEYGVGWAILAWVTILPLLIIPFLAGFGVIYLAAIGVMAVGITIAGIE